MEITDFNQCLEEARPKIGNYGWMQNLLRLRARMTGMFPRKLYQLLYKLGNPARPYFVGKTGDGLLYLGDYREWYAAHCMAIPNHDAAIVGFLRQKLARLGGDYLDVGTNMGIVAAAVAKVLAQERQVIAFEPVPETAMRAAATFALNGLSNVRLFQVAVGEVEKAIPFFVASHHSEGSSAGVNDYVKHSGYRQVMVPCRTLDGLSHHEIAGKVGFIKIDVEGYEPQAVRGALKLITRDRPQILYEYNPRVMPSTRWTASEVANLVSDCGPYRFQVVHEDGKLAAFPPPESEWTNVYCVADENLPT